MPITLGPPLPIAVGWWRGGKSASWRNPVAVWDFSGGGMRWWGWWVLGATAVIRSMQLVVVGGGGEVKRRLGATAEGFSCRDEVRETGSCSARGERSSADSCRAAACWWRVHCGSSEEQVEDTVVVVVMGSMAVMGMDSVRKTELLGARRWSRAWKGRGF